MKKRKSDEVQILTRPELLLRINSMPNLRNKALACFIYLTGCRISEVLGTMKTYTKYEGSGKDKVKLGIEKVTLLGMTKENIEINLVHNIIWVHNVPCLKRREKIPRRTIPIIINQEAGFVEPFLEYYNTLQPGQKLFDISRVHAWRIMYKNLGLYNHFLIHERCTHLTVQKNFTALDLMKFRGWSSTLLASTYAHLNSQDLAEKMR